MVIFAVILLAMQVIFSEETYARISVAMIFLVFAFKSWVNLVFSVTTHKQQGETELSVATERYFWALLGQSVIFSILFFLAFLDSLGVEWFGRDLIMVRNFIRSVAAISVVSVIIYGDQTLEALRDHILTEAHKQDARDVRQDAREVQQNKWDADHSV
jgi:heme exporter protein D